MMRKRGSREGEGVAEGSFEGKKREGALEWEEGGLETNDDPEMTEKEMKLRLDGLETSLSISDSSLVPRVT